MSNTTAPVSTVRVSSQGNAGLVNRVVQSSGHLHVVVNAVRSVDASVRGTAGAYGSKK